jgi:hypothetical protein
LIWPEEATYDARRDVVIPKKELLPPPLAEKHQQDADRRDKLFDAVSSVRILKRPTEPKETPAEPRPRTQSRTSMPSSWQASASRALRVMTKELNKPIREQEERGARQGLRRPKQTTPAKTFRQADIALLQADNFLRTAKRQGIVIGATSLYEIDKLMVDRREERSAWEEDEEIRQLLKDKLPKQFASFADVFSKAASDELPPHRPGVDHNIVLEQDYTLSPSPLYSMSLEQLEMVKAYLEEHLQKGFIVPSDAPFASPVLFAKKPGGGWRFCVDYRKLNAITKKDRYPLPLIEETLARLARAKVFTKLDIRQAFYRIRMKEGLEDLTTFRTRYGSYKYKVLPFGLCNGPASFQRYINDVLMEYLDDFCTAYMDDILIYSEDPLEHDLYIKKILKRLRAAGL